MTTVNPSSHLPTSEVAHACAEESRRNRPDCPCCFELFRRAIACGDQEAWQAIYLQYRGLVAYWVGGEPDQVDARVNEVYHRFWNSLASRPFADRFANLAGVLAFLKKCACSVRIDDMRRERLHASCTDLGEAEEGIGGETAARSIEGDIERRELLEHLLALCDEKERLLMRLSYHDGLKPLEIAKEYPDVFADVREVRRIKERVVLRLSNDPRLAEWRGE